MTIIAYTGKQGEGKSYFMVRDGLKRANREKKFIITNQKLNLDNIVRYAHRKRMHWLGYIAANGYVIYIPNNEPERMLQEILSYENAVVMLDEAQVFLNKRFTATVPMHWLINVAQQRKVGNDLLWCAQDYDRVELNIRSQTQIVYECLRAARLGIALGYEDRMYERIRGGAQIRWQRAVSAVKWTIYGKEIGELYDSYVRLEDESNRGKSVPFTVRPRGEDEHTRQERLIEELLPLALASKVEHWALADRPLRVSGGGGGL